MGPVVLVRRSASLGGHLDEDAVWKGGVVEEVDGAVADEAAQGFAGRWGRFCGASGSRGGSFAHATVHGLVGEAVGVLVFVAESVGNFELFEVGDALAGFFPKGTEVGGVDLIFALDLFDHQLGVGDDFEGGVAVFEGPGQDAEEAGVFGEVVGFEAEKLGEFGELVTGGVGDDGSIAGRAGVAARSAVAVGGDGSGVGGGLVWKKAGHRCSV